MKILQSSIDEVASRADIVSIIGEYIPLTQKGNDWWGCCPFHQEKTASFSVSPEKKFYYCFGCHAAGTVFNFVMNVDGLSYPEAIEKLAKKTGVTLQYSDSAKASKEDKIAKKKAEYINLYNKITTSFHYFLMETESGKFALDYITKRGLSRQTLEKFKIGYSPADRFWLKKFLLKKNYSEEFLKESGLFSERYPDCSFFSDRLMFPTFDREGNTIAFGGRFLRGDSDKSPKYLNSKDLLWFKKGKNLFAFNFARENIKKQKKVIFCEGYMDCIAYHQCGINIAVATNGTALTEDQIRLVKNTGAETVLLSFDNDKAGLMATKKAIALCRPMDLNVKFIQLHGGKDPAEIMQNLGSDALTNDVNNAILDSDFLLSKLQEVYSKDSPEDIAKACLEFFPYIDLLKLDIQKDACLAQLCQIYGIDLEAAKRDYQNRSSLSKRIKSSNKTEENQLQKENQYIPSAEFKAVLSVISDDNRMFLEMRKVISADDLYDTEARKLFIILEECNRSGNFSEGAILNRCDSEQIRRIIIECVHVNDSTDNVRSAQDGIKMLLINALTHKRVTLNNKIKAIERNPSPENQRQLRDMVQEIMSIDEQIVLLKG